MATVWTLACIAFLPEALPNNLILYKICAYYIICRCVISKNNTGLRWYMTTNWIMNWYEKVIKHHSLCNRLSCLIKMKQHFFLQIHIEQWALYFEAVYFFKLWPKNSRGDTLKKCFVKKSPFLSCQPIRKQCFEIWIDFCALTSWWPILTLRKKVTFYQNTSLACHHVNL
mgnify:CR=1 FL=1